MKELIMEYLPTVLSGLVAVLTAVCSALVVSIKTKTHARQIAILKEGIESAKSHGTYTICPRCDSKVYLSELTFYNNEGKVDNDLDGTAD